LFFSKVDIYYRYEVQMIDLNLSPF